MTGAAGMFAVMARSGAQEPKVSDLPPRVTFDGQSTFMKFCAVCGEQMPHIRQDDYCMCAACETKTYAKKPEASP